MPFKKHFFRNCVVCVNKNDSVQVMAEIQTKTKRAASVVGSVASTESKVKSRSYPLWPEFNDADINSEKWEGISKPKDKGKSPSLQFFDDPEGKIELAGSLKVSCWKRPQDFLGEKLPTVMENEQFDLISGNEHILHCSVMRTIICQFIMARNMNSSLQTSSTSTGNDQQQDKVWRPWELIYSMCKSGKGHIPLYNQFGKYVVRLYWMGCWRKIVVDDTIPFDENGMPLLPTTTVKTELWPLILTKAIVKVISICSQNYEVEDFAVFHCLTGWIPEVLPVQKSTKEFMWNMLLDVLPEWKLPNNSTQTVLQGEVSKSNGDQEGQEIHQVVADKEGKKDQKRKDDKEKNKSSSQYGRPQTGQSQDEDSSSDMSTISPEVVVCANFNHKLDSLKSFFPMQKKAISSEYLRKIGLSQFFHHPVYITRIRVCPLEAQPPGPVIPRWKLVRPLKKSHFPSDEPQLNIKEQKSEMWLEIASPFIGHETDDIHVLKKYVDDEHVESYTKKNQYEEDADATTNVNNVENISEANIDSAQHTTATSALDKQDTTEFNAPKELKNNNITRKWIEYDIFCLAFRNITIFHKTETYPYTISTHEFRPSVINAGTGQVSSGSKKGSAQLNQTASSLNMLKQTTIGQIVPKSYQGYPLEDRFSSFLFIDNLKKSELVVEFSVLAFWPGMEEKKSDKDSTADLSEVVSIRNESTSLHTSGVGLLAAESYSWKSTMIGQPILQILTTGTQAACLMLPAGRHVLRFTINFPLGYNLRISSTTQFIFGDEETVFESLQQESFRFVHHADQTLSILGDCIQNFENKELWNESKIKLHKLHMPYKPDKFNTLDKNYKAWHDSLLDLMESNVGGTYEKHVLSFAIQCVCLWIPSTPLNIWGDRDLQAKPSTDKENNAALCIQKHWRRMYARKLYRCHDSTLSKEFDQVSKVLTAFWNALQPSLKTSNCILLRDVFHVEHEFLCLPKLYLQIPTCNLHVIDNDTKTSTPQVFQKVVPKIYRKNQNGYTIVAEARTLENPIIAGKWKLRLIGSTHLLPVPVGNLSSSFHVKEIKDFYIPNNDCLLFRYTVTCAVNHIASIQLETSSEDVVISLQILDNEKEIKCIQGKGHCVIPAFWFTCNQESQPLVQTSKHSLMTNSEKKSQDSPKGFVEPDAQYQTTPKYSSFGEERHSYILQAKIAKNTWPLTTSQWNHVHKLKQQEKDEIKVFSVERDRPGSTSNRGTDKASGQKNANEKGKKLGKGIEKTGKDKKSHDREPTSRPQSQNMFDGSIAFWTLRYVVDTDNAESVEIKKDLHRVEEIRAMKLAWETADPGRSIKAMQSRLSYTTKFLSSIPDNDPNVEAHEDMSLTSTDSNENPTLQPTNLPKLNVPDIETSRFERNANLINKLGYLHKQKVFIMEDTKVKLESEAFQKNRSASMKVREQNSHTRNILKHAQLDKLQDQQHVYEKLRNTLLVKLDEYRKSCLEDIQFANETSSQIELAPEQTTPEPKNVKSAGKKKK